MNDLQLNLEWTEAILLSRMLQRLEQAAREIGTGLVLHIGSPLYDLKGNEHGALIEGPEIPSYYALSFSEAFRSFAEAHIPSMTEFTDPVEQQKGLT